MAVQFRWAVLVFLFPVDYLFIRKVSFKQSNLPKMLLLIMFFDT